MELHVAHIIVTVLLIITTALSCAALATDFLYAKGTGNTTLPYPYKSAIVELRPFHRCSTTTGNVPAYSVQDCPEWPNYWANDHAYCPTIGTTGSTNTTEMLRLMRTAQAGGIIFMVAIAIHTVLFFLYAAGFINTKLALVPMIPVVALGVLMCLASWGYMYNICDKNYCDAALSRFTTYKLTSQECRFSSGVATTGTALILYYLLLPVQFAVSRPCDAAAAEGESREPHAAELEEKKGAGASA